MICFAWSAFLPWHSRKARFCGGIVMLMETVGIEPTQRSHRDQGEDWVR